MPKLYYSPTSCGAASFIAAYTAKVQLDCEVAEYSKNRTASGTEFTSINPKGNVPALALDGGMLLNENIAVLMYIADQAAREDTIQPEKGSGDYYLLLNALSYTASEVHKTIGGLFHHEGHTEVGKVLKENAAKKLTYLQDHLIGTRKFLVGDSFTIADSYLYICLSWTGFVGIDLTPYPLVKSYLARISNLENVKAAEARMSMHPTTVF